VKRRKRINEENDLLKTNRSHLSSSITSVKTTKNLSKKIKLSHHSKNLNKDILENLQNHQEVREIKINEGMLQLIIQISSSLIKMMKNLL